MDNRTSEQGQSLLAAMIGLGIASLMMMMLADATVLSARAQRTVSIQIDFDGLTETLRRTVAYEPSCTPALVGETVVGQLTIKDPLDSKNALAQTGTSRSVGLTLSKIELQDVVAVDGKPGLFRGNLYLEGSKNMRLSLGSPSLSRKVGEVYFETAAGDGKITRCYGAESLETTAAANCKMLGGTWDNAGTSGLHCTLLADKGDHNCDGHLDNGQGGCK